MEKKEKEKKNGMVVSEPNLLGYYEFQCENL